MKNNTNKSTKSTKSNKCQKANKSTKAVAVEQEVDRARVNALSNEIVKNSVLFGSLMVNLFVLTAFMLAVTDAPSAQALGSLIASL